DAKVQNFEIQFLQEAAKFVRDFKSLAKEADEFLDKQKSLELEIERLLKASVSYDIMSIVQNVFVDVSSDLQTELDPYNDMQQKVKRLQTQLRDLKGKSSDTPSASNTFDPLNQKLKSKIVELEFQVVNYEREISHLKTTYKNLFDSIKSNRAHAKLHDLIYENAHLRARGFENTFEPMKNTLWTSVTPHVDKPKLSVVTPLSIKFHASMSSHSVPQTREFNVMKHRNVISPGMFKINPFQTPKVNLLPNKQSNASIRTNPITNSQRHIIVKENVSSNTVTASFTGLKWSPSGHSFDLKGKLVASKETNCPNGDKACTSNPREPMRKRFLNLTVFLGRLLNLSVKFLGTVRFRNDHIAAILGYGDLKWGNITITRVYFVEGLGHNLFSAGQFCDANLEVAFRRNTYFIRDLDGVEFLKGSRSTNLYTINLCDMASAKNDLVSGLPKFKYTKEHLCPSYEQGNSKRSSHPPKPVPNSKQRLHLLHMDLCGPMRVKIYVRLQAPVIIVRTDNGTEFKNQVLKEYFDSVGITHETSTAKTLQQNGVVERRNRTLVKAARTMLIFSHAPLFLWAEAIATAKPNISYLHVFEALCYLKNDREGISKLGAKSDIGFFIGYSANYVAYRVYNRRTKKIMETMNVTFDELSTMAFEHNSSRPGLQCMTSGQISSELELTYAPSTITLQSPCEQDLDILFEPLHNEYLGGRPLEVPRTIHVAPVLQNLQSPTASMSFQDSAPVPTNSSNTPVSSHNVEATSQQHPQ
nr:hypothetical protein [Tanacetum cinerariifolium]